MERVLACHRELGSDGPLDWRCVLGGPGRALSSSGSLSSPHRWSCLSASGGRSARDWVSLVDRVVTCEGSGLQPSQGQLHPSPHCSLHSWQRPFSWGGWMLPHLVPGGRCGHLHPVAGSRTESLFSPFGLGAPTPTSGSGCESGNHCGLKVTSPTMRTLFSSFVSMK